MEANGWTFTDYDTSFPAKIATNNGETFLTFSATGTDQAVASVNLSGCGDQIIFFFLIFFFFQIVFFTIKATLFIVR